MSEKSVKTGKSANGASKLDGDIEVRKLNDANKETKIRLNKFLAERMGWSRREADELIRAGKVKIGEKKAKIGERIDKNNEVWYNGKIIPFKVQFLYLAMNKPAGYVCSRSSQGGAPTVYKLLPEKYKNLKTVGRLDMESCGLILLTNDGDFAYKMTHPGFAKQKVYIVELADTLPPIHQQMITDFGINLKDGKSKMMLEKMDDERRKWRVMISEGRNRQIRRTFGALGHTVVFLQRIQFGHYGLGGLMEGEFEEVEQ